jgi:hypothetical protein
MAEPDRLAAALRYQQELEEAQRPATMNPNMAAQGQRMNLPARQVPGPVSAFGTQAMSLNPQPDQGYGTMAAEMALGFVPGIGQAMAARDIERARRDNDPIGMGMAATSFVPFGKLIGALRGGKQMGPVSELDVYHGSPYKFDKFDASKIGTGEGAQAYGHGLYLAENQNVAKGYKEALSGSEMIGKDGAVVYENKSIGRGMVTPETRAADALENAFYSQSSSPYAMAAKTVRQFGDGPNSVQALKVLEDWQQKGVAPKAAGSLYKVDLPDEQIAKMLDWDKPLSGQSAEVRKAFLSTRKNLTPMDIENLGGRAAVNQLYGMDNTVGDFLGTWQSLRGSKDAGEKMLRDAGIPGIRYLDEGSRNSALAPYWNVIRESDGATVSQKVANEIPKVPAGFRAEGPIDKRTRNFVVFPGSEGLLNILGRE